MFPYKDDNPTLATPVVTLFLIGSALSRKSLAAVGFRPLILGVILWVLISAVGLWSVRAIV